MLRSSSHPPGCCDPSSICTSSIAELWAPRLSRSTVTEGRSVFSPRRARDKPCWSTRAISAATRWRSSVNPCANDALGRMDDTRGLRVSIRPAGKHLDGPGRLWRAIILPSLDMAVVGEGSSRVFSPRGIYGCLLHRVLGGSCRRV